MASIKMKTIVRTHIRQAIDFDLLFFEGIRRFLSNVFSKSHLNGKRREFMEKTDWVLTLLMDHQPLYHLRSFFADKDLEKLSDSSATLQQLNDAAFGRSWTGCTKREPGGYNSTLAFSACRKPPSTAKPTPKRRSTLFRKSSRAARFSE